MGGPLRRCIKKTVVWGPIKNYPKTLHCKSEKKKKKKNGKREGLRRVLRGESSSGGYVGQGERSESTGKGPPVRDGGRKRKRS